MKVAIRVFTLVVVFAGLTGASVTSASVSSIAGPLSASAFGPGPLGLPVPQCGPGVPTCGNTPPPGN